MSTFPRRCSVFSMIPPGLCSAGRTCMDLIRIQYAQAKSKSKDLQKPKYLPSV